MAKKRASKRKSTTDTAAENDESYEESNIVENGEPGSSSSTPGKKKRSAATKAAQKTSKNDEEEEDSEENYEVEQILDVNFKKGGQREFLIRWKNYTSEHDSWEPEGNLSCHELITKFLEGQEDTDTAAGNDENNEESPSTSNPVPGSSKSTSSKKKRSAATKTTQKKETKNKTKSDDEEEEEEENYEVEKILDVNKSKNGKRKFLIRWKNYSSEHDSWEPEENLSCRELITKFLATQKETDADLENDDESQSDGTEDDAAGSSKSTASKKKKSVTSKAAQKKGAPKSKAKSDTEEDTAEEDFEVEKILDVNYKKNGKRLFLIRWKNYSSKHDTWEPEENLSCDEIIKKFLEVQEEREKQPRKELRGHPKSVTRYAVPTGRKSKRTAGSRKVYTEDEDEDDD